MTSQGLGGAANVGTNFCTSADEYSIEEAEESTLDEVLFLTSNSEDSGTSTRSCTPEKSALEEESEDSVSKEDIEASISDTV